MDALEHLITTGECWYGHGETRCPDCKRTGDDEVLASVGDGNYNMGTLDAATVAFLMDVARTHKRTNGTQGHKPLVHEWRKVPGEETRETREYFR